jgi:hypothetical protein
MALTNLLSGVSTGGAIAQLWADWTQVQGYSILDAETLDELVSFDGIMSLEYHCEGEVVSAPIEQGSFTSYNKVKAPDTIRAQLAIQGTDDILQTTLDTLQRIQSDTTLIEFVTPIQEYQNFTLESFDFSQTVQNGLGILYVDINLVEVRFVEPQYVERNSISSKGAKNGADVSTVKQGQKTSVLSDILKGLTG